MRYRITHTTKYSYGDQVPLSHNKLHLAPRDTMRQSVSQYRLMILPEPAAIWNHVDYFGNRVDYFSIQEPHHNLTVTAISNVVVRPRVVQVDQLKSAAWETVVSSMVSDRSEPGIFAYRFAFPSRLVGGDGQQPDYANYALASFTKGRPIVEAARDLTRRVFEDFHYDTRATTVSTPVSEVFEKRAGVCQDFAHFQIASLRALGLAARYVSGYLRTIPPPGKARLVGADASHAWLSLYCGQEIGWLDLDPTNNVSPDADHVTLGWGSDYSDLCPIQGVFVGGGDHQMSVSVDVAPLEEA